MGSRAYRSVDLSIYLSMYLLPKFIGSVVAVVVLRVYPEKQFMNVFWAYEHESPSAPIHEAFLIHLLSGEPSIYPQLQGVQGLSATACLSLTMLLLGFGRGG